MAKLTEKEINKMLTVDVEELELSLKQHAEYLYFVGEKLSDKEYALTKSKDDLDAYKSGLYLRKRDRLINLEGVRVSESCINSSVGKDKDFKKYKDKISKLTHSRDRLKMLHRALVEKGSMMEQIGYNKRKEIDYRLREGIIKKSRNKNRKNN